MFWLRGRAREHRPFVVADERGDRRGKNSARKVKLRGSLKICRLSLGERERGARLDRKSEAPGGHSHATRPA